MRKILIVFLVGVIFTLVALNFSFAEEKRGPGKETGSVVSRAAHKAQEEGLKGEELAARVHEAIEERKEARSMEKEKKMEQKKMGCRYNFRAKGRRKK